MAAIVIGGVAGVLCYKAMQWRIAKGTDESLDAWAVHGVGGFWGTVALGLFALSSINGYSGLIEGATDLLIANIIGAVVAVVYVFGMTYAIAKVIDSTMGLRVGEDEEYVGLDRAQHGESA
jgi:Amt family ammonium transporter